MLEIEHFAAEFVGLGVDEDEFINQILSEDGLSNGHADVSGADDGDFGVAF